jgi:carbon starvation protein
MNVKGDPASTIATVTSLGFPVTVDQMNGLATQLGEKTLFGRTGGAATLAVGMAHIFSRAVSGRWLDLWYHFAIMFEALFILTTLDAGTRVGRYLLQDMLGNVWRPLGDTRSVRANVIASLLVVLGWGYFLIQGVRDPLGGINSLWPLFGVANQLLAAIALCLGTTIILKMAIRAEADAEPVRRMRKPALALITLIPLIWLLSVTMTAGVQKIFHSDPRIGFLTQARTLKKKAPSLEQALATARAGGTAAEVAAATKALNANRVLRFNNLLDASVAAAFLLMVAGIALLSAREWILILARRKLAQLSETKPVWLPDYALVEAKPFRLANLLALAIGLARELSGESQLERSRQAVALQNEAIPQIDQQTYLEVTENRFKNIRRCC